MTAIDNEGGDSESEVPRKKLSGKKIVFFIVLPLVIVVGGGAALYFSGILDSLLGGGKEEEHVEEAPVEEPVHVNCSPTPVFMDGEAFPEILVNLNSSQGRAAFLKLKLAIEVCRQEDTPIVTASLPRINDSFQTYLRELKTDDLRGTAGLYRLREELLMRIRSAAEPAQVKDVLVTEFLIQ